MKLKLKGFDIIKDKSWRLRSYVCHRLTWQLSARQPLAHFSPSPTAGWGREMDSRGNSWVEIMTV